MKSEVCASSRKEWRAWLKKNHAQVKEIWLVYYKKETRKPSVTYIESVQEALCFGWIDGIMKRLDDETYTHRFTPRKRKSKWSPRNITWAKKMIQDKKMTQAGLTVFKQRESYDEEILDSKETNEIVLAPEFEKALKANKKAWNNFNNLAPGYKKQYVGWLMNAKKEETKQKRLRDTIDHLAKNKKPGMM